MTKDMTNGRILPMIIAFTIPVMFSNLLQNLYSMVDTFLVGRFVSLNALAAIGSTGSIIFLIMGLANGLTIGFGVIISQRFGAGDMRGMKRAMAMSWILSLIIGALLTAVTLSVRKWILILTDLSSEIFDDALVYLTIIYSGILPVIFFNLQSSILRAVGDSRTPLLFLLVTSLLNIVLDIILITVVHWGVFGVGIATLISQIVSVTACCIYMEKRYPELHMKKEDFRMDSSLCRELLRIGIPAALQYSVCALGAIAVQTKVNGFGALMTASYAVSIKMDNLLTVAIPALGVTMGTFAGQNLGAGKFDRIMRGSLISIMLAAAISVFLYIFNHLFGGSIARLFVDSSETFVLDNVRQFLHWSTMFYLPLASIFIYRSGSQGLGSGSIPLISSIVELVSRVIVAFVIIDRLEFTGICLSCPIAWTTAGIYGAIAFYVRLEKMRRKSIKGLEKS